ncbi:MAG: IclR family transcriptional regulator [Actinobacteria bacterium]|nr:IclR family transcriptional regulator [Actinomycetota bacterium]
MKSLKKFFNIIDYLNSNSEWSLKELSEKLNINKSTLHSLLSKLIKNKYIYKSSGTKKYWLGVKFLELGNEVLQKLEIVNDAKPFIEELNNIAKETSHLAQLIGEEVINVDKRESLNPIGLYSRIDNYSPWHSAGVGKAILAFHDDGFKEKIIKTSTFEKYTESTLKDVKEFLSELIRVNTEGFATDKEEHQKNNFYWRKN